MMQAGQSNSKNLNNNQDYPQLQENLFKAFDTKVQSGYKEKPNIITNPNALQNCQKSNKIVNFNKGQQNQSYLTSLLFKHAKIDNISVEIKPFTQEYAELMGIIQQRTIGNSVQVKEKVRKRKDNICIKQENEIKSMGQYEKDYIQKKNALDEKSYCLFKSKLMNALHQKIAEISNVKMEEGAIKQTEKTFEDDLQSKQLDSYTNVHKLFQSIQKNQSFLSAQERDHSQMPDNLNHQQFVMGERDYSSPLKHRQMAGGEQSMEIESMNKNYYMNNQNESRLTNARGEDDQAVINKDFTLQQITDFYKHVKIDDVEKVYCIYEDLQKSLQDFETKLEMNVTNKVSIKKQQISRLFEEVKNRIHNQIMSLPLNYFGLKAKEVFDYYQIPAYNETNVNIKQYEQNMKDQRKNIVAYQVSLSLEDLRRLTRDQLINDSLLDCYALYLREAHRNMKQQSSSNNYYNNDRNQDKSEIIIFSHLFFETLYESMRIKKDEAKAFIDQIYSSDKLFDERYVDRFGFIVNVELHQIKHWIFLSVQNKTKEIIYYDSASGNNSYYKNLTSALQTFFQQISGINYTPRKYEKCPRQQNGTDCGMFVLKYMQNFAYNTPQEFDQEHITQLRQKLYTFFPMLSYQQFHKKIDYETLQYFEGRIITKYDEVKPEITRNLLNC